MSELSTSEKDDLIGSAIRSSIMGVHILAKASFDNAHDTNEQITAANELSDTLTRSIEYRLRPRIEEMLVERLESVLGDNTDRVVKIGDRYFTLKECTYDSK